MPVSSSATSPVRRIRRLQAATTTGTIHTTSLFRSIFQNTKMAWRPEIPMVSSACRMTMSVGDDAAFAGTDARQSNRIGCAFGRRFTGYIWVLPRQSCGRKVLRPNFRQCTQANFRLPEATIISRAVREGSQADTHDVGIINVPTVEPGAAKTALSTHLQPTPLSIRYWARGVWARHSICLCSRVMMGVAPPTRREGFSRSITNVAASLWSRRQAKMLSAAR